MRNILRQLISWLLPITFVIVIPLLIERDFRIQWDALAILGALFCLLGLFLLVSSIRTIIQIGRGTLAPWSPAQKLVTQGLYAHMRNPMISGMLTTLLGEALLFHSVRILFWAVAFFIINTVYFTLSEEPGLVRRFGNEYLEYRKNVPRWIPRIRAWSPQRQV